jgi:ATP-dependent RNA helicase DDX1
MFSDGKRLQMIVCSATLHNFDVKKLAEKLMFFPTWVDLKVIIIYFQNIIRKINNLFEKHIKGEDSVPDTVHHIVFRIDPREDLKWKSLKRSIKTDEVHAKDQLNLQQPNKETLSEAVKLLKGMNQSIYIQF